MMFSCLFLLLVSEQVVIPSFDIMPLILSHKDRKVFLYMCKQDIWDWDPGTLPGTKIPHAVQEKNRKKLSKTKNKETPQVPDAGKDLKSPWVGGQIPKKDQCCEHTFMCVLSRSVISDSLRRYGL